MPQKRTDPVMISRRGALAGSAATVLAGLAGPGSAQQPRPYRFKVGDIAVEVISDGHLTLTPQNIGPDADKAQLDAALKAAGQSGDRIITPTNVTLVRTRTETVLIDAGAGPYFMDTAGKLADNMAAAGIDPQQVTAVVLTHGHPDHLWGVIDEFDDSLRFPKARYFISAAEWNLWMVGDPSSKVPSDRQNFIPGARRNLDRIKDRIQTVALGSEIVPGLRAVDTGGHTQGHIAIEIASGREGVLVLGDALTHPVISFAHPDWRPAADHDPQRAIATRKALLDRLASDRTRVIGFHLPFPGVGQVERRGPAYAYVATAQG